MAVYYGRTIRDMTYVHPLTKMKFQNRTSREIEELYFPDAEKKKSRNIEIITDVDSNPNPTIYSTNFFYDTNKNGKIGDIGDTFAFKIILHVSKNGNKVKEAYDVCTPKEGEILLFLEDNSGDFSKQILRGKVAPDVKERVKENQLYNKNVVNYINKNFPLSQEILKQLIDKGYIEEEITFTGTILDGLQYIMTVFFAPLKAVGWIVKKVGDGIGFLKIADKFWDTEDEDYFLKKENVINAFTMSISPLDTLLEQLETDKTKFEFNDLIPDFVSDKIRIIISRLKEFIKNYNAFIAEKINAIYASIADKANAFLNITKLPEIVAFYSGIWNGLVDFISATFNFFGGILEAPFNNTKNFQETLENFDSFIDTLVTINLEKVYKAFSETYTKIKTYFKKANSEDFNFVRIAYVVGFGIAFVATFFIPYTQLVKIGALQKISKIQQEFFAAMKTVVATTKTHIVAKSKQALNNSVKLFENMLRIFAKGKESIKVFLEKIWQQIAEWLLKKKELFATYVQKAKKVFKKDSKTDELFRDISKKFIVRKTGKINKWKFLKIAKQIEKHFGVELHWIDRNNRKFSKLFKKWYDKPTHALFREITSISEKYGIKLEGPGIYFFNGISKYGPIEISYYTLQHELLHLKLWYKMTKEFPKLRSLYHKIPAVLDELNVVGEILKQNAKKIGKWSLEDIQHDINVINGKSKWKPFLKKHFGKEKIEIKDLENWDLSKYLDKL